MNLTGTAFCLEEDEAEGGKGKETHWLDMSDRGHGQVIAFMGDCHLAVFALHNFK